MSRRYWNWPPAPNAYSPIPARAIWTAAWVETETLKLWLKTMEYP